MEKRSRKVSISEVRRLVEKVEAQFRDEKKEELLTEAEKIMREAQYLLRQILAGRGLCINEETEEIVPISNN